MPAGCDGILFSKSKYNKCGLCNTSNKRCRRVKGTVTDSSVSTNWKKNLILIVYLEEFFIRFRMIVTLCNLELI